MKRRDLMLGTAAAVAAVPRAPALAQGAAARTLRVIPQANLTSLDPVWTTAVVTRNSAHLLFETLYGRDERLEPKPQMLEGHLAEDGARRWTMRLREGLRFHDGEPVLARDCVASLRRWMVRDPVGQTIAARLDELEAPDDRTLLWRLRKPFASLPYALAKTQPSPVVMPERLARTDPHRQVPEVVGSGPFRWVADEYLPGSRAVYARFDRYRPRSETPEWTAGGKVARVPLASYQTVTKRKKLTGAYSDKSPLKAVLLLPEGQEEEVVLEVEDAQRRAAQLGQGVALGDAHDQLVPEEDAVVEGAVVQVQIGEDEVEVGLVHQLALAVRLPADLTDVDVRVRRAEGREEVGPERTVLDGEPDALALVAAGGVEGIDPVLQGGEGALHIGQELLAVFVEPHAPPGPVEEVDAQLLLQTADAGADGGGAHMQPFSRFLDVLASCDLTKIFQMQHVHV